MGLGMDTGLDVGVYVGVGMGVDLDVGRGVFDGASGAVAAALIGYKQMREQGAKQRFLISNEFDTLIYT